MVKRFKNGLELLNDLPGQKLVVVALDHVGISGTGLNDIRIDSALGEEILLGDAKFHCLVQENIAELCTDDLPLALGIFHAFQLVQEPLLSVHTDKLDVPLFESGFYFVALIFAHTAVVHKDRCQTVTDRFCQQRCQN